MAFGDLDQYIASALANAQPASGMSTPTSPSQRVGDMDLPAGVTTVDVGKGWYEVHAPEALGGHRIGTLRPGGRNGRFINDTGTNIEDLFAQARALARQPAAPGASGGAPNGPAIPAGAASFAPPPVTMPVALPQRQPQGLGGMPMIRDGMMASVMAPFAQPNWGVPQVDARYLSQQVPLAGGAAPTNLVTPSPSGSFPGLGMTPDMRIPRNPGTGPSWGYV